ncbi:MAG TPA: hypothetical protein VM757_06185 [Sphingomicrobium sp.]|nr:hypothetical protein [Sphingomicrobium sp.]
MPIHLWIVGALSLLWNGFGCYDYLMTRMRDTDYLASMMPDVDPQAMLAYIDGLPLWAQFGWGLGVWLGLIGAALLIVRNRLAVPAYLLSLLGAVVGLGYQLANPMPEIKGFLAMGMPIGIILIALGQYLYARAQRASGVLR